MLEEGMREPGRNLEVCRQGPMALDFGIRGWRKPSSVRPGQSRRLSTCGCEGVIQVQSGACNSCKASSSSSGWSGVGAAPRCRSEMVRS